MNKRIKMTALTICLLTGACLHATAQESSETKSAVQHSLMVGAQLNYASLMRSTMESSRLDVNPWLGSAPGIGVGYHLYKNHFTFDVSGEMEYGVYTNRSGSDIVMGSVTVPGGTTEMIQNMNVDFPVMLGAEFGRFHFKIGAVPSLCVYGTCARTEDGSTQYEVSRIPQLRGRMEIGGQVGASSDGKVCYQLAGYGDFGVLNERPMQRKGSYADGVPYHIADESTADKVHNLTVGLRFTCLFNFSK